MTVLARAVVVLDGDDSKLQAIMSAAEKRVASAGQRMRDIGGSLTTALTLPLAGVAALAIKNFGEAADGMAKVKAVVKATGGAAGITAEHVADLSSQLQKVTTYGDDATQAGAAVILTFKSIRNAAGEGNDVFDQSIAAMQDMAALMGTDLKSAAVQLGRALESPQIGLSMLQRIGVSFSEQQKKQITDLAQQGRMLEAQKLVLAGINAQIGGLSQEMAKTPFGLLKQGWNDVGDALEVVGQIILEAMAPGIRKIQEWAIAFQKLDPSLQKIIVGVGAFVGAIGPLLVGLGLVASALTSISVVLGVGIAPILLVVAAIGALVAAGYLLVKNWTWIKMQALRFWGFLKEMFFKGVDYILQMWEKMLAGTNKVASVLSKLPGEFAFLRFIVTPMDKAQESLERLRQNIREWGDASVAATADAVAALKKELADAATAAQKASEDVKAATATVTAPPPATPAAWVQPAVDALSKYNEAVRNAVRMSEVMGSGFDLAQTRVDALQTAINSLVEAGVPLDAKLDATGTTVRSLATQLGSLQAQLSVSAALRDFTQANDQAARQLAVLGKNFDLPNARAQALESVISALTAAGVGMDVALDAQGTTLRSLGVEYVNLTGAISAAQAAQEAHDTAISNAQQAVAAAVTPQQQYNALIKDLDLALASGAITAAQYAAAVEHARNTIMASTKDIGELKQAIVGMTERGVDAFVDFAMGAEVSFGDMIKSMLADLTKLILKMYLVKFLFGDLQGGTGGGILPGFASGGFLGAGQVGVVGEKGPELISGGRNGVSITPLPAAGADLAGAGGAMSMAVTVNVTAIDSKDTARFFDDNEGLVAGAMMKAYQRSTTLRRQLAGGR